MKMESWKTFRKELLRDPEVKKEYDRLATQYQVAAQIIKLRQQKGLTQEQLADKMGTKQSEIARIESGSRNLSINSLEKIAVATGSKLKVTFSA